MKKGLMVSITGLLLVSLCVYGYFNLTEKTATTETEILKDGTLSIEVPIIRDVVSHDVHPNLPDSPPRSDFFYGEIVVPDDMAITAIRPSVKNIPFDAIHHLNLNTKGKSSGICGDSSYGNLFEHYVVSRTNLHEQVEFSDPYAIYVQKDDVLLLEVMTHALQPPYGPGGTYKDGVLTVELEYTDISKRPKPLQFIRLRHDDTPCAYPLIHQAFAVPAHSGKFVRSSDVSVTESAEWYEFKVGGTILERSVNVWGTKGGEAVQTYINGEPFELYSVYTDGESWRWLVDHKSEPVRVNKGDVITFDSIYVNDTGVDIFDASGMFGFYFAPDELLPL